MNYIICGDCIKTMREIIPNDCVDLIVTSPPYNCGIDYDVYNDNLEWSDYLHFTSNWLLEAYNVLNSTGRIAVNVLMEMGIPDPETGKKNSRRVRPYIDICNIMESIGYKIFGCPIWVDDHRTKYTAWGSWMSASAPYIYNPFEVIIIAYKENWKKGKGESTISKEDFMMGVSGIWKLRTETKGLTKANFHKDLPRLCINLLSFKDDIVLDPFNGSGTTTKVAHDTGRRFVGIDISRDYCDVALSRIDGKGTFV